MWGWGEESYSHELTIGYIIKRSVDFWISQLADSESQKVICNNDFTEQDEVIKNKRGFLNNLGVIKIKIKYKYNNIGQISSISLIQENEDIGRLN